MPLGAKKDSLKGVCGTVADSVTIASFLDSSITLRLSNGAQLAANIPPYPLHLYAAVA